MRPPYVPGKGNYGINEPAMLEELPMIDGIAKDENLPEIDVYAATERKDSFFPDRVHPNNLGAFAIAAALYQGITGNDFTGTADTIILTSKDWTAAGEAVPASIRRTISVLD